MSPKHPVGAGASLALAAALIAGCAGTPAKTSAPAGASKAKAVPAQTRAEDRLICTYERPVGSHLPQKVCMTQRQREALAQQNQDAMRARTEPRSVNPGSSGR